MHIETLAIGDELLTGKIADTNSAFVADTLFRRGFRLERVTVVPDSTPTIQNALKECAVRSDFVLCFGGLGPTSDDKTAACVAELLGGGLAVHAPSDEKLRASLQKRGLPVTQQTLKQVLYPERANPILNEKGMAPGFHCSLGGCRFYFMPGVPSEMKAMFTDSILPEILSAVAAVGDSERILSHVWKCLNITESELQRVMDPIEAALPPNAWLGYRTRFPENHLTLYFRQPESADRSVFEQWQEQIRAILKTRCYTEEDKELEQLVLERLARLGYKVAFAESCTGGLTAQRLSRIGGASDWLWGGYISYRVEAKDAMLGVKVPNPEAAVSAQCTRELAEQTKRRSGCEVAAAITGYMGPTGGTPSDPLGTVYLCVSGKRNLEKRVNLLIRERSDGQWGAATHLLNLLREYLETEGMPD